MKKFLLFLMFAMFCIPWAANAQTTVEIGDGTATSNQVPIGTYYNYSITEMLYTADEIGMAGTISSISFYYMGIAARDLPITVYMQNVDVENLSTGVSLADAQEVFSGTLSVTTTAGWVTIDLDAPFAYDGTSNLLIGINKDYLYYFSGQSWQGTTVSNMARYTQSDGNGPYTTSTVPGNTASVRPNIQIEITPSSGPTCERPDNFVVSNITGYGADFAWTGTVGNYTFEYKKASETDWTVVTGLTATNYTLSNLETMTAYNARVKAVCGTDFESGYKTANFTTLEVCPDGKICIGEGTATNTYLPTYNLYDYSLTEQIYTASEIGQAGAILSVDIYSVGTVTRDLEFYMVATTKDTFDSGTDWITATASDLVYTGSVTFAANSWNTIELDNPFVYDGRNNVALIVRDMTGSWESSINFFVFDAYKQAIRIYRDGSAYELDNPGTGTVMDVKNRVRLVVGEPPACLKPTGVTVNYTGGTEATISWTSDATSFNIDVNGVVTNNVPNPYTLTGLDLATEYSVMVQADCGSDGTSEWTNAVNFTTDACMPENKCELTFTVTDSWGDGWNGASIDVYEYDSENNEVGDLIASITNENLDGLSGSSQTEPETQTYTLSFCDGQELAIIWTEGSYDSECSYTITDLNEDIVAEDDFELAMAYTINCTVTDCRRPSNFVASNILNHSVELSWTENGPATEWEIAYMSENDTAVNYITVTTNPYTLTGLTPETMYAAQVTPVCEMEKPSEIIYWTTDVACPTPSDLTVTPYPTSAEVSWTGIADAYDLEWAEAVEYVPSTSAITLQYDDDTYATSIGNTSAGTWTWGVMYPSTMLGRNNYLTQIAIYENDYYTMDEYTVSIYSGDTTAPITLLGTETVTPSGDEGMHVITLVEPITINPRENLWITVTAYGTYVMNSCETTEPNNQWVYSNGTWANIGDLASSLADYGWMIRATIDNTVPSLTWNTVANVTPDYTIEGLTSDMDYVVRVKAVCGGEDGESAWTTVEFSTPNACDSVVNLTTDTITATSATLNWTGYQESYNLRYWIPAHLNAFNEEDFTQVGEDYIADSVLQSYTIDLSAFNGVGNVAIRHYNITDMFRLNVDDIVLTDANGTVLVSEDFESGEMPFGWVNYDLDGDGYVWDLWNITQQDNNGNDVGNGSYCATSASYNSAGALLPDNWLIIPNVQLGGTLTFVARGQDPSWAAEIFGVFVSTTELVVPGSDPVVVENVTNPYELEGLTPNTPYEWQVQGVNTTCGYISWSETATFTTPEQTILPQTIALAVGTNWVSFNVETNLDNLKAALVEAAPGTAITIKGQTQNTTYNPGNNRWTGQLRNLDLSKMYIIKVTEACEIVLEGEPVDPSMYPILIEPGVNYIAYPFDMNMTVTNAFAGFGVTNDQVRAQLQNASYNGSRWTGQLRNLEPGQGYIYKSASTGTRTFTYPSGN